jgi:hypothetical protein
MFRSRHQVIVSMALVATLFAQPVLIAQDPTPPGATAARDTTAPHPRALCFRERPMPECSGFTLVELMGVKRLAGPRPYRASFGQLTYIGAELGGMKNRGPSHAIGAAVTLAAIDPGPRASIAARYRTWNPDGSYQDLSLGVVGTRQNINEAGSGGRTAYGITTELSAGYSVVSYGLAPTPRSPGQRRSPRLMSAYGLARTAPSPPACLQFLRRQWPRAASADCGGAANGQWSSAPRSMSSSLKTER